MVKIHKIDPNADTVIILKNPLVDFAVWNCPDEETLDATDPASPVDIDAEEHSAEGSAVELSELDDSSHEMIQYHVSSSVLKLASSHFERMLSGNDWKEGIPNEDDGRYHIDVEDWDEEALLIFLNALHLRNRQVPRSLSLEMLAKIALLIDYYNCAETVELWTEVWTKDLSTSIGSESIRNLFLGMYIAWVLQLPDEFTRTTAAVIERSKVNELSISNLPVARFVDRITSARIHAIDTIVSRLYVLRDRYFSVDYSCSESHHSFECGSMLYGALTKGMESLGLLSTSQEAPFFTLSLREICKNVREMRSPEWYAYHRAANMYHRNYSNHSGCGLTKELQEIVDEVQNTIRGLDLTDFARVSSS